MKRNGFATMVALMMLAVVAAAIVALTGLLSMDARSTARSAESAQLRQLLLAGAADVQARLKQADGDPLPDHWAPAAPQDLGAALRVQVTESGNEREARVSARMGSEVASQTVRFERVADRWDVVSAELGD